MIKLLKQYQITSTPFNATKNWSLNNTDNTNLLLTEDDYPVALEFIDYSYNSSSVNSNCDIALEQQDNNDANLEEGRKVLGSFYPNLDPINLDGTYKRSIYYQIRTAFYNKYYNPSKIWGLENIDFELSKTKRILTDQFLLMGIPRKIFGDKIIPNSITIHDNSLDNPYTITDDGNGNLFAGINLFSHQQEVGEYKNGFIAEKSSSYCDFYWPPSDITTVSFPPDVPLLSVGLSFGSMETFPLSEQLSMSVFVYNGSLTNTVITVAVTESFPPDEPTMNVSFMSGSLLDTVILVTSSFDNTSVTTSFVSGSIFTTVTTTTSSFDNTSVTTSFASGSVVTTTFEKTMSFDTCDY